MLEAHDRLPWPLIVLDFEASALGMRGFPIEVGLAVWPTYESKIDVWSTLIKPTEGWLAKGVWKAEAEAVHRLRPADLADGMRPADVMAKLNDLVSGAPCWCDGGPQDDYWLGTLGYAAGTLPTFKLKDWDALGGALSKEGYRRMVEWMEQHRAPHRAGADAERLLRAVAVGLGAKAGEVVPEKDLSSVALRTFANIATEWSLDLPQQMAVLGGRVPLDASSLTDDELLRISYVIGIYKDINILLPIRQRANLWMRAVNEGLNGASALDCILSGDLAGLQVVRQYLAAQTS